jgi:hypothetical protein
MSAFREVLRSLRASPVFGLYVLVTLGIAGVIGSMVGVMQVQPGFLGMAHFTDPSHRVHELTYAFLFAVAVIGLLAQLRQPSRNLAGMLMAVVPWLGLLLAAVLAADARVILSTERLLVATGTVMAAVLHPAARSYVRSFSVARVNRVMLALTIVAAVPLLAFAWTNVGLQRASLDDHAAQAHYGFMAAFGFTVVALGLLSSLRLDGWWLPAWVASALPLLLGLASLVYSGNASSLGVVWALAAIGWGLMFVAAAERTQEPDSPTLLGSRRLVPLRRSEGAASESATHATADLRPADRTPRWLNVLGLVALVPIALFFALPLLAGGPPGGHLPGQGPGQGTGPPGAASPGPDHEGNPPPIDGAPELAVSANRLTFAPDRIELNPSQPVINIALTSVDTLHDLTVDEIDFHLAAEPGETAVGGISGVAFGNAGTYIAYCSVPGHREAGMELEIVVAAPPH